MTCTLRLQLRSIQSKLQDFFDKISRALQDCLPGTRRSFHLIFETSAQLTARPNFVHRCASRSKLWPLATVVQKSLLDLGFCLVFLLRSNITVVLLLNFSNLIIFSLVFIVRRENGAYFNVRVLCSFTSVKVFLFAIFNPLIVPCCQFVVKPRSPLGFVMMADAFSRHSLRRFRCE